MRISTVRFVSADRIQYITQPTPRSIRFVRNGRSWIRFRGTMTTNRIRTQRYSYVRHAGGGAYPKINVMSNEQFEHVSRNTIRTGRVLRPDSFSFICRSHAPSFYVRRPTMSIQIWPTETTNAPFRRHAFIREPTTVVIGRLPYYLREKRTPRRLNIIIVNVTTTAAKREQLFGKIMGDGHGGTVVGKLLRVVDTL